MRKEFPGFRQLPELSQYEDDEEKASIRIVDLPGLRVALISEDDTEVIQLQSDRFIFNWRTGETRAPYPGHAVVRERFELRFEQFRSFLLSEDMVVPTANRLEMTYVNRVESSELWSSVGEMGKVIKPSLCQTAVVMRCHLK